ncbi:MAG: phytanoyl-CoA dioxygenase family protein [Gammaproteobacteria bacterium]|nr:phytanoyl-CoA dioxygenase family protein [Gammaproteobacteria bacterium]
MLTPSQYQNYQEQGYLLLENQIPGEMLSAIHSELEQFNVIAKGMKQSDDRIDLEESHSTQAPRIRRIKLPHLQMSSCRNLMRHDCLLEPVRELLGANLRLHTSKLNMKRAGYGAAVEWHQDWAFYPHTNDDILAVGVMLDDMTVDNGPLLFLPGSHRGQIYNHHSNGEFVGAISPDEIDTNQARVITAPAGSISLHHVRLVHGSDTNRSRYDRRLLLYEITAADAFPIMGAISKLPSIEEYDGRMLCGESTIEPRMSQVPIRIPLPAPRDFGSIYQLQSKASRLAFSAHEKLS